MLAQKYYTARNQQTDNVIHYVKQWLKYPQTDDDLKVIVQKNMKCLRSLLTDFKDKVALAQYNFIENVFATTESGSYSAHVDNVISPLKVLKTLH